jgi:hypothetical protein
MLSRQVLTGPLVAFLLLVAGLLVAPSARGLLPSTLRENVQLLADGDLEHEERRRCLQRILDAALAEDRLFGAMAAAGLEDRQAFDRLAEQGLPPGLGRIAEAGGAELRALLGLGDPVLAGLLDAALLEAGGELPAASRRYEQLELSSRLFHNDLVQELAVAGQRRLR